MSDHRQNYKMKRSHKMKLQKFEYQNTSKPMQRCDTITQNKGLKSIQI
jgi:hypothetical protein